ncbi:MAG: 50S ribosomal protein L24 [Nitrosotalea sp.]
MKPTKIRKRMLYTASQHLLSKQLGSHLSKDLREKYHCKSIRVVEGDSVKVLRGEFKGIEGKVTRVSTEKRGIAIEGIKREKLKGGNVDIFIHPSNVIINSLNLEDKWRQSRLEGQKPKTAKIAPAETKEAKPKEQKEASKEKPKEVKSDDKKTKPKTEKKETTK